MNVRLNVAAAIVRDDKILLVEFDDDNGLHYNLPGGGVEAGESIYEALRREVREECAAEVDEISALLMMWEYIGAKQDFIYGDGHKVALLFPCTLHAASEPHLPSAPDAHQTAVKWIALDELHSVRLIPNITDRLVPLLHHHSNHPVHVLNEL